MKQKDWIYAAIAIIGFIWLANRGMGAGNAATVVADASGLPL